MTIGSILLGVALLVAVGLYVTRPIFMRDPHRQRRISERQALLAQKEAALVEIRDLDFDFETGKVSQAEYETQREAYMNEAADLLRWIDELDESYLEPVAALAPESQPVSEMDEIEAAIARQRAKSSAAPRSRPLASDSGTGQGEFCPQCGKPTDAGDRFCAHCGHQLIQPQPA